MVGPHRTAIDDACIAAFHAQIRVHKGESAVMSFKLMTWEGADGLGGVRGSVSLGPLQSTHSMQVRTQVIGPMAGGIKMVDFIVMCCHIFDVWLGHRTPA